MPRLLFTIAANAKGWQLYEGQYGRNKGEVLAERCRAINPGIDVDPVEANAEAWWCARDVGRELEQLAQHNLSISSAIDKVTERIDSQLSKLRCD